MPAAWAVVDQAVQVGQGAEDRIDVAVVGDVVAEVGHRRAEDRRQPDRVDAEIDEVVEAVDDPGQVADAVAVRVLERARIDLVDDAGLPPRPNRRTSRVNRSRVSRWTISRDRNWAGNQAYRARRLLEPESVEAVQAAVRSSDRCVSSGRGTRSTTSRTRPATTSRSPGCRGSWRSIARPDRHGRWRRPLRGRPGARGGRIRAAQSRFTAAHLGRRRLRDRHARVGHRLGNLGTAVVGDGASGPTASSSPSAGRPTGTRSRGRWSRSARWAP